MTQVLEVLKKCQLDIDHVRSDLKKGTDKHQEHVKILESRLRDRQLLQTKLREKYIVQSTIPLSPIMKKMKVDINKVYQKLVMRPDLIHDPNVNRQAEHRFLIIETNTEINGYREIFFNKGEPCQNIFVVGNGGIGKTTWCLKLLSSWVNCETSDKDKDVFQRFKYVFYVQLRHTKQASQINDMIKSYLFSDEHDLMNIVNDVLLNEPEHCLVLLDGLDEWKLPSEQRINDMGLPHDPMHSKYTTLITSRPWKLETLRLEPTAIDKAVEIKGLDEYGIHRFAKHIIDQLNRVHKRNKEFKIFNECISKRKMPMIEVPLMLSIFVYLWYENEFIGETFAGLYGKLTKDFFKHAEGDKRQIRQNREVSKLADIKDIETRKTKWSNISISLPDCLSKGWCKSYSPLLYSLGKLAFDGLMSINNESFLVFNQESIEEYMSEEELDVALYIGILSQSQSIGDSTGAKFSVSFMHKTIQEFLAAVYMVSATEHDDTIIKSKFTSYCKEIEKVFEIENVLIFICGMDPKLAGELTRQISIMHKTKTITLDSFGISDDERLHETLLRCVKEEHLYLNESNHVYIVNHFIQPYAGRMENRCQVTTETLSYIHTNKNRIRMCLNIDLCSNTKENKINKLYTRDPEEDKKYKFDIDAIRRCLSGVHSLEHFRVYRGNMPLYNTKGCLRISECINHLHFQTLELKEITGNLGHIDLSNNTELTDLSLKYIQLEELSLPKDRCLQSLELKCIKHPQGDQEIIKLDMKNQPYLKWLKLLIHPQGDQESINFNMKHQPSLKLLTIDDITGNIGHINLSNNSKLTELTMVSLQIEEMSLPQYGCLQTIKLKSIKHPHEDQGRLTLNINKQQCLKHLGLEDITGNIGHINLSNNSKLTDLTMTSLQIEELSLPQVGCLETVEVKSIKHPQGNNGSLTLNMNNQPHLERLTLDDITGNVGHIDLSNNSKLKYLSIPRLHIEELTLPQYGCLETLELKSIKHPDRDQGRLSLKMNNQPYLNRLTLDNIIGNVGHIDLSNNSKLTDLTMTSLQKEELTLPQDGCLEIVELKSIKHPQGNKGSLTLNINNQPHLERLSLEDITGNVGHIDLFNNLKLKYLSIPRLHIEELTLPQDGCLETLELKSIKHPQVDQGSLKLNMNNQPHLERLTLEVITGNVGNINMSNNKELTELTVASLQVGTITLPQYGCLQTIKLKSIKHPQGDQGRLTLNLINLPHLKHLTLEDISGKIGHINLSNSSKLTHLTMTSLQIEELSLPQNGCLRRVELKSIKHPQGINGSISLNLNNQPCLKHLTLHDIQGNIGHIILSNNAKLTYLYMTSLQTEEVSLPQDERLQSVELKSINHPQGDQERLTLNMNNQPHLYHLTLEDIKGNVGHINLSFNSKLESLNMTSLQIEEISLPQNGCLESVWLKYLKHPQGDQGRLTFNMNNQQFLNFVTIEDIIGNIDHIDLSYNSKLTVLAMTSLQLEELSLPNDGCLQRVEVKSIKHPQGDQGILTLKINNQSCLNYLTLVDIIGNVGHITLSNNSKLKYLSMASLQIETLLLPNDGCIQRVGLKSIKHPQEDQGRLTLNMNNQPWLNYLELEAIKGNIGHINLSNNSKLEHLYMTSLQIEEVSLPIDGCLQCVCLKSIKHLHGDQCRLTFNMENQPHLEHLSLEDIKCNIGHIDLSDNENLIYVSVKSVPLLSITVPKDVYKDLR